MDQKVTCIVLCYNGLELTVPCLESLLQQTYHPLDILVVDSASQDDTVATIRRKFPHVGLIASPINVGYATGNNLGMKTAIENGAEILFLVNNDTLLEPSCIAKLVESLIARPQAGIVGPMVYTFDPGNIISSAGGEIDWAKANSINIGAGEDDQNQYPAREVDFINGCGLMIRRDAIQQAGFLDESYFMYWEEVDWCTCVKKAAWQVLFNPTAKMRHKAPITSEQLNPTTLYYMARNRLRFFITHTPWPLKPITLMHAYVGIVKGIYTLKRNHQIQHAKAVQVALYHGLLGKGSYTEPSWLK